MKDGQGRTIEYLRVSVTDRCNLKCTYCMPPGGADVSENCDMMRLRDLHRLIEVFADLGVRKVRLTGGEPLLRRGFINFVHGVNEIEGIEQIALTTNGILLKKMAGDLIRAGVDRVNISLDTLQPERFKKITGYDSLDSVMEGIEAAIENGFKSVKVNQVVMAGVNDDEIEDFARLSMTMPIQIRFIEFMPATPEVWNNKQMLSMTEVENRIKKMGDLIPCEKAQWGGPAKIYRLEGALGEVGFISAVSNHFCDDCNRLRITSTGALLTCLFGESALDLKALLQDGSSTDHIKNVIMEALKNKNAVREMVIDPNDKKLFTMSCVGG